MNKSHSPEQLPPEHGSELAEKDHKFFPSGAIAFFILLVALCLIIWFGIYFLMLERM